MEGISTKNFSPILLEQMDEVKLMNRVDTKFCLPAHLLPQLLENIQDYYYTLNIDGKYALPYATKYFDTPENTLYATHHRGKKNRFKIRRRQYLISNLTFLEIKQKNNKGRTTKKRMESNYNDTHFSKKEKDFLATHLSLDSTCLRTTLTILLHVSLL